MWLLDLLNGLGAIALFIFGMKIMSEAVQRASGKRLRQFLNAMTGDRYKAFLAGLGLTSVIQSSSGVSVLTLSFVSAGLLNLLRAFAIVIGANIGTTITLWIVFLGVEFKLSLICLPLILFALPFYLSNNSTRKAWAAFVIGFSLIFIGLNFLETQLISLTQKPFLIEFLSSYTQINYFSTLIYLLIGFLLTVIMQSSSASTTLMVLLINLGVPLELAAAMIVGANIGTTTTAQIAATVGNTYAKMTAHFHTFFNLLGAILFFFFIGAVIYLLQKILIGVDDYLILASFHTLFNVVTGLLLFPFLNRFVQYFSAIAGKKENIPNKMQVSHSAFSASPEMYIFEAQKKLGSFASIIRQTINHLGRLITESDDEKFEELLYRIKKMEAEGDAHERDIINYLNTIYQKEIMGSSAQKIHQIMSVSHQLESIGDMAIKTAYTHKERRETNSYITPQLRTRLIEIQDLVSTATTRLIQNLNEIDQIDLDKAKSIESKINETYHLAFDEVKESILQDEIKPISGIYYKELIQNYEIIGDHIHKANKALCE